MRALALNPVLAGTICMCVLAGQGTAGEKVENLSNAADLNAAIHQAAADMCLAVLDDTPANVKYPQEQINSMLDQLQIDAATQDSIQQLNRHWAPVDAALTRVHDGADPQEESNFLGVRFGSLAFASLQVLDEQIRALDVSEGSSVAVRIGQRQRVYLQQIRLHICHMAGGENASETIERLATQTWAFEQSLDALAEGRSDLGLPAPDSYALDQVLAAARLDWDQAKTILDEIALNGRSTNAERREIENIVGQLDQHMRLHLEYQLATPPTVDPEASVAALIGESN